MSTSAAAHLNPVEALVRQYQLSQSPQQSKLQPRLAHGGRSWHDDKWEAWCIGSLLSDYPGLSLRPADVDEMVLAGTFTFAAVHDGEELSDSYEIRIATPKDFPRDLPTIHEIGNRIPEDFHKLDDGSLCLGSRLRLHMIASTTPTLHAYVRNALIPYLYGFTYRETHGTLPFGELGHSVSKFIDDYMQIFRVSTADAAKRMIELAAMPRRRANKRPCQCGSRLRVGRCHHLVLNRLRDRIGHKWFQGEHRRIFEKRSAFSKALRTS